MTDRSDTESGQSPEIVAVMEALLKGDAEPGDLMVALRKNGIETARMRDNFLDTISLQPPSISRKCEREIREVNRLFDEYEKILEDASKYVRRPDKKILRSAIRKYREMTHRLNTSFMQFREAALVALGPSNHGGINLLIHNCRRILKQKDSKTIKELQNNVMLQKAITVTTVEQISSSQPTLLSEDTLKLHIEYIKILDSFGKYFDTKETGLLESLIQNLAELGEKMKYFDLNWLRGEFSREPTAIPPANLVINCVKRYREGTIKEETILHIIREFRDSLVSIKPGGKTRAGKKAHSDKATPPLPESHREAGDKVILALNAMKKALEDYGEAVLRGEAHLFPQCEKMLVQAARLLEGSLVKMKEYADSRGCIPCPFCGRYNAAQDSSCAQCSTVLPFSVIELLPPGDTRKLPKEERAPKADRQMTAVIFRLFDAADGLIKGHISKEEFTAIVKEMEELIMRASAAMKKAPPPIPEGQDGEAVKRMKVTLDEAHRLNEDAVNEFLTGLGRFREFAEDQSESTLNAAKENVLQSLSTLQKVRKILFPLIQTKIPGGDTAES